MLHERVTEEFKQAMKAGDQGRRLALSLLRSAFQNKAIEKGIKDAPLSDDDALSVLLTEVKKRKDAMAQFRGAAREELAAKEEAELAVFMQFLPEQLSEEKIRELVEDAVAATGAKTMKETGKVLAVLGPQLKGRADMTVVMKIVKEMLSE